MSKVFVLGLDAASPYLTFERFIDKLPNIKKLLKNSLYGKMQSCDPPITIPAWMVMACSVNPGKLGIYGFRHRKKASYSDIWIADYGKFRYPKVWDIICLLYTSPSPRA